MAMTLGSYRVQIHAAEEMAFLRSQYDFADNMYFIPKYNVLYNSL